VSTAPAPLKTGDVLAKTYEIDAVLGAGPEGSTYLAHDLDRSHNVVLKLLPGAAETDERARALIQRVDAIGHDGVVRILATGEVQDGRSAVPRRWIAMEQVDGTSLRELIDSYVREGRKFTLIEACQIVVKILEVVDAAHQKGLVHRHIKPTNVIVQSRQLAGGRVARSVRVTGFAVSDMINPQELQQGLTEYPSHLAYAAPEQISPSHSSAPSLDIYSVGVILYELLTGQPPRGTYLPPSAYNDALTGEVGRTVDDIVELAMARERENRYLTARDMLSHMQRTLQGMSADEEAPTSSRTTWAVVGATVIALAAVGSFIAWTAKEPERQDRHDREELASMAATAMPSAEEVARKRERHPDMQYIPPGQFLRGRLRAEETTSVNEPLASRTNVAGFLIDAYEYPNEVGKPPVTGVSWEQAERLCKARGKRLCTEFEWERACKGPNNAVYTYGDAYDEKACGAELNEDGVPRDNFATNAVGAYAGCKSGWGVFDLSGGLREWVANDGDTAGTKRIKGGKANDMVRASRCGYFDELRAELGNEQQSLGFRCCLGEAEALAAPTDTATATDATAPAAPSAEGAAAAPAAPAVPVPAPAPALPAPSAPAR
jgi:serine/threonine protein kinase